MKTLSFGIVALSMAAGLILVGREFARRRPGGEGQADGGGRNVLSGRPEGTGEHDRRLPGEGRARAGAGPVALVAPHAGYIYSGPVAAYSYALLKGRKYDRVVVVAPSHYEAFGFTSCTMGRPT